jgi:hypothetical protein
MTKSTPEKKSINLRALGHQMERLATLEERITGNPPDQEFLKYVKITAAGIFRVVVMGEIKKGKSSFINALTGTENLVPVHSDVATSTVYKIHFGPEVKYTVYFDAETGKEKLLIQPCDVDQYGTEAGNPENEKRVEYIRVESPAPILKNGLVIVDTPGVGGLFKKHREITWRHAPDADAVFFITESDGAPIGEDEVNFLKELKNITPLITFVQTKSSKVDDAARKSRMANNLSILRTRVGIEDKVLQYFIVDSKLKVEADQNRDSDDLNDSGFGPLMSYLNNTLRKRQELHIAQMAIRRTLARALPLAQALGSRKEVLDADTQEKRAAISREIEFAQKRLYEWERESKPQIHEQFKRGMHALTQQALEDLSPLQPSGSICSEFSQEIWNAVDVDHLKLLLAQVHNDLAALTSQVCVKICDKAKNGATSLLESLTRDVATSMTDGNSCELTLASVDPARIWVNTDKLVHVINKDTDSGFFEGARTGLYGGMAGVAIASVVGGIIGSVIPVVGTIAGSWVGMTVGGIWGGHTAVELDKTRKLEALKQQADNALQQALSTAYQSSTKQVNRLLSELQLEATSVLQRILDGIRKDLESKQVDVSQRQKATLDEVKKGQKEVAESSQELQTIQKSLTAFRSEVAA